MEAELEVIDGVLNLLLITSDSKLAHDAVSNFFPSWFMAKDSQ